MKSSITQKAQVSLETTALAVLAMAALLAMGTYSVRAINAYFKLSEDTVEDSQSETMHQAPWGDETPCFCDLPEEGVCGEAPCNPWQKKFTYVCNAECVDPPEFICVDARADCCEEEDLGCHHENCGNRERAWDVSCEGEDPLIECRYDPECSYRCTPPSELPPNSEWCKVDGSPVGPTPDGLTGNMQVTFVEDGPPDKCTGALCEAICKNPFIPRDDGNDCYCPPDMTWDEDNNECISYCFEDIWVQKPRSRRKEPCETICSELGGHFGPDPNGMECISGENWLCDGVIDEEINYWGGREGPCHDETFWTRESYSMWGPLLPYCCYHQGQRHDRDEDDSDDTVACYCTHVPYCCCKPMNIATADCGTYSLPETLCQESATVGCSGAGGWGVYCDGSVGAFCEGGVWTNIDNNCEY